jgi:Helicase associated domain
MRVERQPKCRKAEDWVPRYEFKWANLPEGLSEALCRDLLDNQDSDPAAALQRAYGARPTAEFIRDAWPTLLDSWLRTASEPRERIVQELQAARGDKELLNGGRAELGYLKELRNAKRLREIVWAELVAVGEIEPTSGHDPDDEAETSVTRVHIVEGQDYASIVANIRSNLTGDPAHDGPLLLEYSDQYRQHPVAQEILREIGRMLYAVAPPDGRADIDQELARQGDAVDTGLANVEAQLTIPADQWEDGFRQLEAYIKRHGHARVPGSHAIDGYKLGSWVNRQRSFHARGVLGADRERRLGKLPGWTWDILADRWEDGFRQLEAYVKRHGHARVPRSCTVDGYRLGGWVGRQRSAFAKGTLDPQRDKRLQGLPGWTWDPVVDKWEEGFDQLEAYVKRHGHARVPASHAFSGYTLGRWVNNQRVRHAKGILDPDRERRLEELRGWTWEANADMWEESYGRLVQHVKRQHDASFPASCTVADPRVDMWVRLQRTYHRKGILDADRERRLEEVPGWTWDPFADQWEEGFRRLEAYVKQHGHAQVPQRYTIDGYRLGMWVNNQRTNHRKGALDADRERRLEEVLGWTWKAPSSG